MKLFGLTWGLEKLFGHLSNFVESCFCCCYLFFVFFFSLSLSLSLSLERRRGSFAMACASVVGDFVVVRLACVFA